MKLYNTLTQTVDELKLINSHHVGVYTCGPTVYDYAHVGHWFNYVRMDMLIRSLKANDLEPKWIMNITDVGHLVSDADEGEDKLEKGARRENKTAWEVAKFYTEDFLEGMEALNILKPDRIVKATDHIHEQIALIKTLEQKGYTYTIDDGVYYDTSLFAGYASFARLDLGEQQAGARVDFNPQKRNKADFALWKFSPLEHVRDMQWDSPWGVGFPGWHIECSAMSMRYLGPTIDIHTGGIDHIPTHHTNEIAQSEAATGKRFANYWLHSNHVLIDGEKVSKSLGNGIRLKDITDKGIPLQAVRLHILESHYRNQSKFTWESLNGANNRLQDLRAMAALRWQAQPTVGSAATFALEDVPLELKQILSRDIDTPAALAFLSQVSTQLLTVLIEHDMVDHFQAMLQGIDDMLGLELCQVRDINNEQKQLIRERQAARDSNNWERSDEIRDQLNQENIGLRDTPHGVTIWYPLS